MKSRKDFETEQEYKAYLRTQFAMAAMEGIISNRELQRDMLTDSGKGFYPNHIRNLNEIVAYESISIADELLKQLEV